MKSFDKQLWMSNVVCCLPQKRHVEVQTFGTSECNLSWKYGLYKDNQIEITLLDWRPYKKGQFRHRHLQGEESIKT